MQDLGTLPGGTFSNAVGVNNAGQAVGQGTTSRGAFHAFLYNGDSMIDINMVIDLPSGWTFSIASAINDGG